MTKKYIAIRYPMTVKIDEWEDIKPPISFNVLWMREMDKDDG